MLIVNHVAPCVQQARAESRMKVLLSGMLDSAHGAVPCLLRDLSRGGACLESQALVRDGERITFFRAALRVSGIVTWSQGNRFGMRFDDPIRATELLVQMSDSRRNHTVLSPVANAGLFPSN